MTTPATASTMITAAQQNLMNRQTVLQQAVAVYQPINSQTFNPAQTNPINIQPRYAGLMREMVVEFEATITNNDTANALTLTDFGVANLFSNVQFVDLNGFTRINTTGWHLDMIDSIKSQKPSFGCFASTTNRMVNFGENFPVILSPATIAPSTTATIAGFLRVPISYHEGDLRGAILMAQTNATARLVLSVNQAPFAAAGADTTNAIYSGTTTAVISSVTINVYQNYLDQLPVDSKGAYILPVQDLAQNYELITASVPNIAQGVENYYLYPNQRDFLSTIGIFDNNTTGNAGRTNGSDTNYYALKTASMYSIWQKDPATLAAETRRILKADFPLGCYYFNSRHSPIQTSQFGNISLALNPKTSSNSALWTLALEDFYYPNVAIMAGSVG